MKSEKLILAMVLAGVLAGGIFAQEDLHKHKPFDMLLGLNLGIGVTPNIGDLPSALVDMRIPKGNYAMIYDFGLTYDFYFFNWLSFNTGLLVHPDIYLLLDQDLSGVDEITDIAASPFCVTIPLGIHVNVTNVEWLYVGIGLNLNIPVFGLFDELGNINTKGDFFVGLPTDIGFDFMKPGGGGGRFFFRITPEFHEKGTAIPIGFIWQIYNWKL